MFFSDISRIFYGRHLNMSYFKAVIFSIWQKSPYLRFTFIYIIDWYYYAFIYIFAII